MEHHGELGDVRAEDGEHVSLPESPLVERRRHGADDTGELAEGQGSAGGPVDERGLVAQGLGPLQDELGERHLRDGDVGVGAPHDHSANLRRAFLSNETEPRPAVFGAPGSGGLVRLGTDPPGEN